MLANWRSCAPLATLGVPLCSTPLLHEIGSVQELQQGVCALFRAVPHLTDLLREPRVCLTGVRPLRLVAGFVGSVLCILPDLICTPFHVLKVAVQDFRDRALMQSGTRGDLPLSDGP